MAAKRLGKSMSIAMQNNIESKKKSINCVQAGIYFKQFWWPVDSTKTKPSNWVFKLNLCKFFLKHIGIKFVFKIN